MKFYLLFACLFFFLNTNAQTSISGKVVHEKGVVTSGTVILKNSSDDIMAFAPISDNGFYEIETDETGEFLLSANSLGFEEKIIPINLKRNDKIIVNFSLQEKTLIIDEVFVEATRAITVKKDTIIFNADSFKQGNEQVVEDLLRKIPGLTIDDSGTIKVGNQEVEKVMIDGDDMFEKGYKVLTKNMPVNPVDKVELYQHYSNNKHLKGVENSDKVALNLTLKGDSKHIWFGNVLMGYGLASENRYEARTNLMNFGSKNKYYFLSNLNNIGEDAIGEIDHLIRPYRIDEPGTIGDDQSLQTSLGLGFSNPPLKSKRVNLNNAEMVSLNSIFTLSEKFKLKLLGFFNTDENDFFRNSYENFFVENISFVNTENFVGQKRQITGFGKVNFTYHISKTTTLEYTGKFNATRDKNRSDLFFNDDLLNERLSAKNQLFDQHIFFTNKRRENQVFVFSGRYINEKTPQVYSVNQFILDELFSVNADNSKQKNQHKMQFAGVEAHFLDKKKNGDLLEMKAGTKFRIDCLNSDFQLYNDQDFIYAPNGYQNRFNYSTNDVYASVKYRFKINKLSLSTQTDFHQLFNTIENFGVESNQSILFVIPKIGLDVEIDSKNKITSSYSYNTTNASVLDVYSGYVQTGFRSFSKGMENFNQLNSSTATFNYSFGNWSDRFFANAFVLYSKNNDFISTNSNITQNYVLSEKIVIEDSEFFTASVSADNYFRFIKSNLKMNIGFTQTNFKNIVNNSQLREVTSFNTNFGLELRSGFNGFFNYHFGSKWNQQKVRASLTNSFTNNMTFLDFSFICSEKFNFELQGERYYFGNLDKAYNQYYFLDLEARYIAEENKLTFSLSGNNLLNTETFRSYAVSDILISQTEYRLMPRYVLLKMELRF